MSDATSLKRCSDSEHEGANPLPASEFGKQRGNADGLRSNVLALGTYGLVKHRCSGTARDP